MLVSNCQNPVLPGPKILTTERQRATMAMNLTLIRRPISRLHSSAGVLAHRSLTFFFRICKTATYHCILRKKHMNFFFEKGGSSINYS
jgi:hypothetical protein